MGQGSSLPAGKASPSGQAGVKRIEPVDRLFGEVDIPGDKSISHRAIMLGSLANGETSVKGLLDCDDCDYTIRAFRQMGIAIEKSGGITVIKGNGLKGLTKSSGPINVGNSGTTMRIMAGILAGQDFESTLTGDESLSNRPMKRITEPLSLMGADIKARGGEYPPLVIKGGPINSVDYKLPIPSAQIKSAVLFAGLYAYGVTTVKEDYKSRDHTERMMKYFGADLKIKDSAVSIKGSGELKGRPVEIPGDISAASFFMAGAILLKGSRIRINRVGTNPTRAGILGVLSKMGARVKLLNKSDAYEPSSDIIVEYSKTRGTIIEEEMIPSVIDELPIIFVLACLSEGRTVIKGAGELRVKETDRINSMKDNLQKMGARLTLKGGDIVIDGVEVLSGASLESFGDHRTCMSMAVAALAAKGSSSMDDIACVGKSFPEFFKVLDGLKK